MGNLSKPSPALSALDQVNAAWVVLRCMQEAASYYLWHYNAKPLLERNFEMDEITPWQNSETTATILSIRALDDFVSNRRRFDDDLTADQLPFLSATTGFLRRDERDHIGKHLAHLTTLKFQPEPPFEYRDYLRRLYPVASRICKEIKTWAAPADSGLATFANHLGLGLQHIHDDYVLGKNAGS